MGVAGRSNKHHHLQGRLYRIQGRKRIDWFRPALFLCPPHKYPIPAHAGHGTLSFLSALFLVWLGLGALSHFLFNVADSAGAFCHETDPAHRTALEKKGDTFKELMFRTRALFDWRRA